MLWCPVVERRQYTLHLGTRATLIDLCAYQCIESQAVSGIQLIGQFRVAWFVTAPSANTLPSRTRSDGEHVVVRFTGCASQVADAPYLATRSHAHRWQGAGADARAQHRTGTPEVVRLAPTVRSRRYTWEEMDERRHTD